jgi:penicillin-binding protein 1A
MRRVLMVTGVAALLLVVLAAAQLYRMAFVGVPEIPDRATLWSMNRPPGLTFQDRYGEIIATRGPKHGQSVKLETLPSYLPKAFLAAEDRRFYEHRGVDGQSIVRAFGANVRAGGVVQGGSTLTQQLAKTIFLTPEQTLRRKLQEAVLAVRMERVLSKDEVLALYLDRVFFGENAFGVEAASQTYFAKSATEVSLSEAALLAALPKAPTRLDPTNDLEAALARSRIVLSLMLAEGWITAEQERLALATPPRIVSSSKGEGDFGYILDLAAAEALDRVGRDAPDLVIRLTVDPALQSSAQQTVRQVIRANRRRGDVRQAALVALAPDGAVRALVGGLDHRASPYNRAVQAQRQPGSAFKPFVYAAALEKGVRPGDIRIDRPVRFGSYSPRNYGDQYRGALTVQDALMHSVNTVAVQLTVEAGRAEVGALARRFGLSTIPERPPLSVALGAKEVSLLDLTGAYQVFQRGGQAARPYLIERIENTRGDLLWRRASSAPVTVYPAQLNAQMVAMMKRVVEQGTGAQGQIGRPAAAKTGTSQRWRDAWFVGFTPDWVAGVWVGNDDNRPMNRVVGGDIPAEIWRRFMLTAHKGLPVRDFAGLPRRVLRAPAARAEQRSAFYDTLSSEFEREADEAAPTPDAEPAAAPEPSRALPVPAAPAARAVRARSLPLRPAAPAASGRRAVVEQGILSAEIAYMPAFRPRSRGRPECFVAAAPIIALKDVKLADGPVMLFDGVDLALEPRVRACLVGRNGAGKSTLMRIMTGLIETDGGERFVNPATRVALVPQEPRIEGETVLDHATAGGAERHQAEAALDLFGLDSGKSTQGLSGGEIRRAALARAFAEEPDVILLDEPTNHLDIFAIATLEDQLASSRAAALIVSHDRAFLERVTQRCFWLEGRRVRRLDKGFKHFEAWADEQLEQESEIARRADKAWSARPTGCTGASPPAAPATRAAAAGLMDMRAAKAGRMQEGRRPMSMAVDAGSTSGKIVADADKVAKRWGERVIFEDFSTRILRGERLGIVGPNGAGKTTLVKLLLGETAPTRARSS